MALSKYTQRSLRLKKKACTLLAQSTKKKITRQDVVNAGRKVGLSDRAILSAWNNFNETGGKTSDKRVTTKKGTIPIVRKEFVLTDIPSLYNSYNPKKIWSIIVDYMTDSSLTSRGVCNKYNIRLHEFYGAINELNVSGTIKGKKVLDVKKYAKLNIIDVIWLRKHPNTKRKRVLKLSKTERLAYEHVADVILKYPPRESRKKAA